MTLIESIGLATVPVSLLTGVALVFVGAAFATKKNRLETIQAIQSKDFCANRFTTVAGLWALYFHRLFGDRILAKRQILTIPIYTLLVSGIFFLTWLVYLYIFKNPSHTLSGHLPITFKQAVSDFYHKGIVATLLIDFATIQFTKVAIRTGTRIGYYSARFAIAFLATLAIAYFLFSIAIQFFRIEDMVSLYMERAPNDPMPVMPYAPFANLASSLSLFQPQTFVHVTTQGWFSSYFMPEPLIFYCAVAAHLSLVAIALAYQVATALERLKNLCIGFVKSIGTPQSNAYSVISLVVLWLASIPVIALTLLAFLSSK
jgi:hypothetical protein